MSDDQGSAFVQGASTIEQIPFPNITVELGAGTVWLIVGNFHFSLSSLRALHLSNRLLYAARNCGILVEE